ncbi:ABC transporter ATP-binding protein [Lactobacillus taiwanensis]|uniref:ABC transporter ATP-binding protein n=1 Tax=Lactobacillus taiwanensis TaxID=508451 RepID=UPI000EEAB6DA|nr:ABC transporter ATP-binding protein [Lactobacillus taiwanensis]MRM98671.1 ABC transporter ATP-binding protein [Lactobacillus taiwanensis]
MNYLFHYLRKRPGAVGIVIVLTIITSALRVVHALINVNIFNALIKLEFRGFFYWVIIDILIFAILSVFLVLMQIQLAKTVQLLSLDLRKDIICHLSEKSIEEFNKQDTGVYTSWLTNDVTTIENNGFYNILQSVQIITDPLFSMIALAKFSWTFIPIIALVSTLTVFLPQLIHKKLANASLSTTKANGKLLNVINDSLRGFNTFSIFGVENQLETRITKAALFLMNKKVKQARYQSIANNIAGFSNILGQVGIQAWTGYLALEKIISIGVIGSSGNLAYNVFNSLAVIAPMWTEMTALKPIFDKYHLEIDSSVKNKGNTLAQNSFDSLKIVNLQKKYQKKSIFNSPINLEITKDQKIGVYGESGSGKSTLLKIISGQIRKYTGSVMLNNSELKAIKYNDIRNIIAYIDQSPYLFNDPVRYNLTLGKRFTDKEVERALKQADLWNFVNKLPSGLNSVISENGNNLSGEQKQRLALARGLLRKRQVFLLDESTGNLDRASAVKIENTFLNLKNATVIFVSHQLHQENNGLFNQIIKI